MPRRLLLLLAALTALAMTSLAGIASAATVGAAPQTRVWAFTGAGQAGAGLNILESSCTRQGSIGSSRELAAGFCVAAEDITGDMTSERAARRAAFRSNNVPTSAANSFERVPTYGQNPNLLGPLGEPYETLETTDVNGEPVSIPNHSNGHLFTDTEPNTYEGPHYHGASGEHYFYGH